MSVSLRWNVCWIVLAVLVIPAVAGESQTYGEPLTGTETVPIARLLAHPDDYVGKTVRVEGRVTGVCPKRGCWMNLSADEKGREEIRIKVDDGVIVFPMEAMGRNAVAEGVLTRTEMTLGQTVAHLEHEAEELGKEFDPASVTEPMVRYQIRGTGAVLR